MVPHEKSPSRDARNHHKGPATIKKLKSSKKGGGVCMAVVTNLRLTMAKHQVLYGRDVPMTKQFLANTTPSSKGGRSGYKNPESQKIKNAFKYLAENGEIKIQPSNVELTTLGRASLPQVHKATTAEGLRDQIIDHLSMDEKLDDKPQQISKLRELIWPYLSDGRQHTIREVALHAKHKNPDSPSFKLHITLLVRQGLAEKGRDVTTKEEWIRFTSKAFPTANREDTPDDISMSSMVVSL